MACVLCDRLERGGDAIHRGALFSVLPHLAPGVPGWVMLVSNRCAPSWAELDDREAAAVGPVVRHVAARLAAITGAERIYTAALGEAVPHFHVHLVPRRPDSVRGWPLFAQERAPASAEDAGMHQSWTAELRRRLAIDLPPR